MLAAELEPWSMRCVALLWGAIWGSFFQVVVYRWPRGLSVVSPPSQCPHCGQRIAIWRNMPIFGYLMLRGKSACCGKRLSPYYLLTEVLSALLCLAVVEHFVLQAEPGRSAATVAIEALLYFSFTGGLLVATFIDLEWMLIPDDVTLPGAALGLATVLLRQDPGAIDACIGAGLGFLIVQVGFVWLYQGATGRRGMGEGDAKLLLFIGAFLGWQGVLFSLALGAIQGVLAVLVSAAVGKPIAQDAPPPSLPLPHPNSTADDAAANQNAAASTAREPIEPPASRFGQLRLPFGPFLSLAALQYLFFGDRLIDAYLRLLRLG